MDVDSMVWLVTGLVKDRLLECMGEVLQQGLCKGRNWGSRLVLMS